MWYILTVLILSFTGCQSQEEISVSTSAQRIVSITPANTEILFALGLDNEIVGVTTYCNYPVQALSKEKVGDFSNPNLEKIISLKPDIIFGAGYEQSSIMKKLKALNLTVYEVNPNNIAELYSTIRYMGEITKKSREAEELVKSMQERVRTIENKVKAAGRKARIFIEINSKPLMTASNGSFINEIISIAGENMAVNLPRAFCQISEEYVIQKNPDVIILTSYISRDKFLEEHNLMDTNAVRNNRVYDDINPDILVRSSPRLVDGLEAVFERCYEKK